jgi:hypothetical protein
MELMKQNMINRVNLSAVLGGLLLLRRLGA